MGLTISYSLRAPASDGEASVRDKLAALRLRARELSFTAVSPLVERSELELIVGSPMRGFVFPRLEDVVDVAARAARDDLYRRQSGALDEEWEPPNTPADFSVRAIGFAVAPGPGSEPAAFGLATSRPIGALDWHWEWWCKTQYASNHGDENFLRCHGSLVSLLDSAASIGIDVDVHDESGFWESRNTSELLARVGAMNRLVARIAGTIVDATRAAGIDSHDVQGSIFEHPDFERLESEE